MPAAVFIALRKTKKAGGLANLQIFSNFVHTNMEPAELISAIRAGSREAFDEMCGRYYAPLTAYARLFLNGNWAQDVVQDVFVNVWVRREALDPGQSLYGYLLRSVYNQSVNYVNKHRHACSYRSYYQERIESIGYAYYDPDRNPVIEKLYSAGSAHEYQRGDRSPPGQMPRGLFAELPARVLPPRDQRTDGDCAEHGRKPYLPCPEATAGEIVEIGADSAAVFHFFAK